MYIGFILILALIRERTPMEENIKKIKDSIIDEIWTEDFHHSLSELELWNYIFHLNGDRNREINLGVLAFHLPE